MWSLGSFARTQPVVVLLALFLALPCSGQQSTTTAVITDRAELTVSGQFGVPNQFKLADTGDVFFTSGANTALFRWSQAAGGLSRLLQTNDPLEVMGLGLPPEFAGSLIDAMGLLQVNAAGHAAFFGSAAIKGEREPAAVFVYDGSSFRFIDTPVDTFTQVMFNNRDRVALLGNVNPLNIGFAAIYVETDSGVVKVAEQGQPVPPNPAGVTGNIGSLPQLIGFNDAGQLAFFANIQNGNVNRALFLFDGQSLQLIAGNGGTLGGNFSLPTGSPASGVYYALDAAGRVAFFSSKGSEQPAIWIGSASDSPKKLVGVGESSGVTEWGNCTTPLWLRGFNDSGKVLYDCDTTAGPNYALFLKDVNDSAAQVVLYRGQPGGPKGEPFYMAEQAILNNSGKVLFLARSANFQWGWYLGSAAPPPAAGTPPDAESIATQGDATPLGGAFGLAGKNALGSALLNAASQVVFLADILDLNAVGLFSWTPGGPVQPVVTTMDSLPDGANTVLRSGPPMSSDKEALVRVLKAGGQLTVYAAELKAGPPAFRKIIAEFDQVPGGGAVVTPSNFSMNGKGEAVFFATLLRSDSYPRLGILGSIPGRGTGGIVLNGDNAPGGGFFNSFSTPQLNNQTQVAFYANTNIGAGIFIASEADGFKAVVRQNNPSWLWPDGGQFGTLGATFVLNDNGQVAFRAVRSGTGTQPNGLFVSSGDTPAAVALTGTDLPGVGRITSVPGSIFRMNASGQVAFYSGLSGAHIGGIFLGSGGAAPQPVALTGDPAPGAGNTTFGFFREESIDLNASGQVAFWSGLCCSDVGNGWFLGSASASPLARLVQWQPLPGGGRSGAVSPGNRLAVLADSGEMAIYVADTNGTEREPQIVIAGVNGQLREIAGSGANALGTGSVFGKLFPQVWATSSGRFLFSAALVDGPDKAGIFIDKP